MFEKPLNYTDSNGNTITAEHYFISNDPKPTIDISNDSMMTFQTHCKSCGAPVDLNADKCPYCDTPYEFIRGRRRNAGVYDDAMPQKYKDLLSCGAISINEMRELCGLPKIFEESR